MTKISQHNQEEIIADEPLSDDWLAVAQDWQQQAYKKTDLKALTQKTALRIIKAKVIFVLDLLGTLLIIGYFIKSLLDFNNITELLFAAFMSVGTVIYMIYSYKIRKLSWQVGQGTPQSALNAAIIACKSSIEYMQLLKISVYVGVVPINAFLMIMKIETDKPLWLAVLFTNSIISLFYFVTLRMQRKRKKELIALTKQNG